MAGLARSTSAIPAQRARWSATHNVRSLEAIPSSWISPTTATRPIATPTASTIPAIRNGRCVTFPPCPGAGRLDGVGPRRVLLRPLDPLVILGGSADRAERGPAADEENVVRRPRGAVVVLGDRSDGAAPATIRQPQALTTCRGEIVLRVLAGECSDPWGLRWGGLDRRREERRHAPTSAASASSFVAWTVPAACCGG